MTKILFICHGNICRSAAAEMIAKDLAEKAGLGDGWRFRPPRRRRRKSGTTSIRR